MSDAAHSNPPQERGLRDRLLISVQEAARLLGISRSSIYKQIAAGNLHPRKLGGRTLFSVEELNAFAHAPRSDLAAKPPKSPRA